MLKHINIPQNEQAALVLEYQKAPDTERGRWILGRLYQANVAFITERLSPVLGYCGNEDYEDAMSDCFFYLKRAVENYEPGKNVDFICYFAWWITAVRTTYLRKKASFPVNKKQTCNNCIYRKLKRYCYSCKQTDKDGKIILTQWRWQLNPKICSLDKKLRVDIGDKVGTLKDFLKSNSQTDQLIDNPLKIINGSLSPMERKIVVTHLKACDMFGSEYGNKNRLRYVAEKLDMDKSTVSTHLGRIRQKIRPRFLRAGYSV